MSHSTEQVSKSGHQIGKKSKFQSCPNEMKFSEYLILSLTCKGKAFFLQNCPLGYFKTQFYKIHAKRPFLPYFLFLSYKFRNIWCIIMKFCDISRKASVRIYVEFKSFRYKLSPLPGDFSPKS